jgi:transposase
MSRPLSVRKPSPAELRRVHQRLEEPLRPWQRRRAEVLLLRSADLPATAIARLLQVHVNTVYADLRDFARHGLSSLSRPRTVGAPPRLSQEQIATVWRLAAQSPTTLGLPFGRWTLAKLRDVLIREKAVKSISREHLRRVLKKGDIHSAASAASSSAPTRTGL